MREYLTQQYHILSLGCDETMIRARNDSRLIDIVQTQSDVPRQVFSSYVCSEDVAT